MSAAIGAPFGVRFPLHDQLPTNLPSAPLSCADAKFNGTPTPITDKTETTIRFMRILRIDAVPGSVEKWRVLKLKFIDGARLARLDVSDQRRNPDRSRRIGIAEKRVP